MRLARRITLATKARSPPVIQASPQRFPASGTKSPPTRHPDVQGITGILRAAWRKGVEKAAETCLIPLDALAALNTPRRAGIRRCESVCSFTLERLKKFPVSPRLNGPLGNPPESLDGRENVPSVRDPLAIRLREHTAQLPLPLTNLLARGLAVPVSRSESISVGERKTVTPASIFRDTISMELWAGVTST